MTIVINQNGLRRVSRDGPVAKQRRHLHAGGNSRRNCVDVWPYLTDVLRRIAAIAPNDIAALEALLPNRWVAVHPEHRLEQREEESANPGPSPPEAGHP